MATYKVIQDIEAEDKLLGPLTLRQFIYAGVAAILGYLTFLAATKGAAILAVVFVPLGGAFAFLAWPWSRDQPTEIWALAKIRFLVKPRRRIWNQSGAKELVAVTAPKKIERHLTNGLSQTEVKSRLQALADTIDSRGWVIKNVNVNLYGQPSFLAANEAASDRLISLNNLPQAVPTIDVRPDDDMLDEENSPLAQKMDDRLNASSKEHRQKLIDRLRSKRDEPEAPAPVAPPKISQPLPVAGQSTAPKADYWFLNQPASAPASVQQDMVTFNTQLVAPGTPMQQAPVVTGATPTEDEAMLLQRLTAQEKQQVNGNAHLHTIQPLSTQGQAAAPAVSLPSVNVDQPGVSPPGQAPLPTVTPQQTPMGVQPPMTPSIDDMRQAAQQYAASINTPPVARTTDNPQPQVTQGPDAAILELARNDDLNVATIAREAHKRRDLPQDEVVISLH